MTKPELTTEDYLVEKLAGSLMGWAKFAGYDNFKLTNHRYVDLVEFAKIKVSEGFNLLPTREETFEEWKARKSQESTE